MYGVIGIDFLLVDEDNSVVYIQFILEAID